MLEFSSTLFGTRNHAALSLQRDVTIIAHLNGFVKSFFCQNTKFFVFSFILSILRRFVHCHPQFQYVFCEIAAKNTIIICHKLLDKNSFMMYNGNCEVTERSVVQWCLNHLMQTIEKNNIFLYVAKLPTGEPQKKA